MNSTLTQTIFQRFTTIQQDIFPVLEGDLGISLTPKLEKLIHVLDWAEMDRFIPFVGRDIGRPQRNRIALAHAFIAKIVLGITQTSLLIERLESDRSLRRICGFTAFKSLPSESTFSRAFAEFSTSALATRTHEALVRKHLGHQMICHISRDGTAIDAREKPAKYIPPALKEAKPRGRPRKGEVREPKPDSALLAQSKLTLSEMLKSIPTVCDKGTKCNAQGYKNSWRGYKLHIDTSDLGIPISAILSSASMHDSKAAQPLALISAARVRNCYDLMDAAYCSEIIRQQSLDLGHIPLIDHNPRGGDKIELGAAQAKRYNERTAAERCNARLKDEFGGRNIWVRGAEKVMCHLMFGILVLSIDQLMRLGGT